MQLRLPSKQGRSLLEADDCLLLVLARCINLDEIDVDSLDGIQKRVVIDGH